MVNNGVLFMKILLSVLSLIVLTPSLWGSTFFDNSDEDAMLARFSEFLARKDPLIRKLNSYGVFSRDSVQSENAQEVHNTAKAFWLAISMEEHDLQVKYVEKDIQLAVVNFNKMKAHYDAVRKETGNDNEELRRYLRLFSHISLVLEA